MIEFIKIFLSEEVLIHEYLLNFVKNFWKKIFKFGIMSVDASALIIKNKISFFINLLNIINADVNNWVRLGQPKSLSFLYKKWVPEARQFLCHSLFKFFGEPVARHPNIKFFLLGGRDGFRQPITNNNNFLLSSLKNIF